MGDLYKAHKRFIWFVVVLMVLWVGSVAYLINQAANEVASAGGLKPLVEQLWCGKPGCLN